MQIHIIHIARPDPRLLHCKFNGSCRFFAALLQANAMKRLACRAIPANFCQNLCPTCPCMLVLLEHKHPRTLSQHESIAIHRKWPRSALGRVIPRIRQNLHQQESLDDTQSNRSIRPATQHHIQPSGLNLPHCVSQCIRGRRAPGRHDVARPAQSKAHAEFARECPHHARRHAEQTHALVLPMEKKPVLFFSELLRSSTRPDDHAEATFLGKGQGSGIDARYAQRLCSRRDRQRQYPRDMLALASVHPRQLIEISYLAGNLYRNF